MSAALDAEAADDLRAMSRSERAETLFGFEPWEYQSEVLDAPESADSDACEVTWVCGRQVGKTKTASLIPADYALTHAGEDVLICARYQETADELFRETKAHLENTGLPPRKIGIDTPNATTYEFDTGARIMSRTLGAEAKQQRGKSPRCVIVEEAALVLDPVYERVIEPMFATHDDYEIYLISTPRGTSGYLWRKHAKDGDWQSYHVPTSESPLVDDDWLKERKRKNDEITWQQEYLGEFVPSEDIYLPSSVVDPCVFDPDDPDETLPERSGREWLGVDPARSGADRSVYVSIDADGVARVESSVATETVSESVGRIKSLNDEHGYARIGVDQNAVGGGVVDLAEEGLSNVWPVTFSSKTKQAMYQNLKRMLEAEEITLPNDEPRLVNELTSLEYSFTTTGILKVEHPPGGHDDHADALALAAFARQRASTAGPRRVTRDASSPIQQSRRRT